MSYTISADEVRNKLINTSSIKFSDTKLEDAGNIPLAVAMILKIIGGESVYDDADSTDQALLKGAGILLASAIVAENYPEEPFIDGTVQYAGLKSEEKLKITANFEKRFKDILNLLGFSYNPILSAGVTDPDNMVENGSNLTNIDFTNSESPFSFFH